MKSFHSSDDPLRRLCTFPTCPKTLFLLQYATQSDRILSPLLLTGARSLRTVASNVSRLHTVPTKNDSPQTCTITGIIGAKRILRHYVPYAVPRVFFAVIFWCALCKPLAACHLLAPLEDLVLEDLMLEGVAPRNLHDRYWSWYRRT